MGAAAAGGGERKQEKQQDDDDNVVNIPPIIIDGAETRGGDARSETSYGVGNSEDLSSVTGGDHPDYGYEYDDDDRSAGAISYRSTTSNGSRLSRSNSNGSGVSGGANSSHATV